MTPALLPPRFDPRLLAELDDPYPTYERLRTTAPLCRGGPAQWVVSRYADIAALIGDPRLGSEYGGDYHRIAVGAGPLAEFFGNIVLNRDPPAHTRLRGLFGSAFTRTAVRARAARLGSMVDELLDPARDGGPFDAVTELADQLPIRVLADLIGIGDERIDEIRPRAVALSRAFATFLPPDERQGVRDAVGWLRAMVTDLLCARRRAPRDDFASKLAELGRGMAAPRFEELVDNVVFLLFAGFSTTTDLLASGCAALAAHPDQFARLRADPALARTAVEEFLRYDAPVQLKSRVVREPVRIGERTIRPGRIVVLLLGSANRDPHRFTNPGTLDIGRHPNPHLSFGGGNPHHCVGAALARAEAVAVCEKVARTFSAIEPDGPVKRRPTVSFRSYSDVPLRLTAR